MAGALLYAEKRVQGISKTSIRYSGRWSYVDKAEWERILEGFKVESRGDPMMSDRWAIVSTNK